jgi:MYXO-CTERM domain-containing protein
MDKAKFTITTKLIICVSGWLALRPRMLSSNRHVISPPIGGWDGQNVSGVVGFCSNVAALGTHFIAVNRIPAFLSPWPKLALGGVAALAAVSLCPGDAKAVLTYNIFQSGSDVVVQASGGLLLSGYDSTNLGYFPGPVLSSSFGQIATGPGATPPLGYYAISGPTSFAGTANLNAFNTTTSSTGIHTALNGNGSRFQIAPAYVSGSAISSSATFANKTLASLGLGSSSGLIGTWTLTSGGDKIYACVGSAACAPAPAPGPLPLLGAGAAFGWSRRMRKRIGSAAFKPNQG